MTIVSLGTSPARSLKASLSADQVWLDNVNKERARERQSPVSYEVFEIIFDKLEKEYFDLVSR